MDIMRIDPEFVGRLAAAVFFGILFLQSGLDKASDWKGNLEWLKGHFSKTLFHKQVPVLLATITLIEILAGVLSTAGAIVMLVNGRGSIAVIGITLSAIALLMLFLGQRLAKDYAGAASLAIYFGVALLSLLA
jgi:hypothetical protein